MSPYLFSHVPADCSYSMKGSFSYVTDVTELTFIPTVAAHVQISPLRLRPTDVIRSSRFTCQNSGHARLLVAALRRVGCSSIVVVLIRYHRRAQISLV